MADSTKMTADASHRSPATQRMEPYWRICQDIKAGTPRVREEKVEYLPRFEAEEQKDWDTRIKITFVDDYYNQTLHDHVGLVFAEPPQLGKDVPASLEPLLENVDGEGTHWEVFAERAFTMSLDYGHGVLLTDYPTVQAPRTMKQAKDAKQRPYWTFYRACDVCSWKIASIGGVRVIVQIVLQETFEDDDGDFATCTLKQYRVLRQAVVRDQYGTATNLGAITWELWREQDADESNAGTPQALALVDSGTITGPPVIPVRVIYGGERVDMLESKPALLNLAYASVEHTQVGSDYAMVMHKCNVPTPIFTGRGRQRAGQTTKMGVGIDLPMGASANMLEPKGTAIGATRQRLEDILARMKRSGAFVNDTAVAMTATEAALYAKQRNAKLASAARSLQDALEGALSDMAAFMGESDGGSVVVNTDFNVAVDSRSLAVYLQMYQANALPLWALLEIAKTGKFPDDFDVDEAALELTTQAQADAAEQARLIAEQTALAVNRGVGLKKGAAPLDATDPKAAAAGGDPAASDGEGVSLPGVAGALA